MPAKKFGRYFLAALLTVALYAPAGRAAYTAIVTPLPGQDQADSAVPETVAWHLQQAKVAGGGIIRLTEGVYQLRQSLVIPDNTSLLGQSTKVILRAKGKQFFDHLINNLHSDTPAAPGAHNVTLANLTLIGKPEVRLNCIQIVGDESDRSDQIVLRNITTHHCGRHGIHIKGANHVTLKHIVSHHNGINVDHDHNIYLLRVTDAVLENITTFAAAGNGLSSTLLKNAQIEQVRAVDNGRRGVRFGAGNNISLRDCTILRNGLKLDHQADGIVIVSDDYGNNSSNISISQCSIRRNRNYGVRVSTASGVLLKQNEVSNNMVDDYLFINSDVLID